MFLYLIYCIGRQLNLPGLNLRTLPVSYGGELTKGKAKTARPIDPKQALHVVLRSSRAKGELSLLHPKNVKRVHDITMKLARRLGVRVYRYANVGNHLHLLVKVPNRAVWKHFSRKLSGAIAQALTGARKGCAYKDANQERAFWDNLLFTRIVKFGRDFEGVARYVIKNLFESTGVKMANLYVCLISKNGTIQNAPS